MELAGPAAARLAALHADLWPDGAQAQVAGALGGPAVTDAAANAAANAAEGASEGPWGLEYLFSLGDAVSLLLPTPLFRLSPPSSGHEACFT